MPLMSAELYDALKEAGTSEEKARKAAEAVAAADQRFTDLRVELVGIRGELLWIKWMLGMNTTLVVVVLGKMLFFTA